MTMTENSQPPPTTEAYPNWGLGACPAIYANPPTETKRKVG
jgi:hypothetical protein